MYDLTPPGTVAGLAWTSMGGSALYVESIVMKEEEGKGGLKVTGNIKDVMKESSDISLTVARNIVKGTKYAKVWFYFASFIITRAVSTHGKNFHGMVRNTHVS